MTTSVQNDFNPGAGIIPGNPDEDQREANDEVLREAEADADAAEKEDAQGENRSTRERAVDVETKRLAGQNARGGKRVVIRKHFVHQGGDFLTASMRTRRGEFPPCLRDSAIAQSPRQSPAPTGTTTSARVPGSPQPPRGQQARPESPAVPSPHGDNKLAPSPHGDHVDY